MLVTAIVFSRNRAMQLDALLTSMNRYAGHIFRTPSVSVLYRADGTHKKSYHRLQQDHGGLWIEERGGFDQGFQNAFQHVRTPYLAFFTDDDIFFREPIEDPVIQPGTVGYSFRLGKNTTWCYMLKQDQSASIGSGNGTFEPVTRTGDFTYPFSIDGHIYRSDDVKTWIRGITFNNPNQFEDRVRHNVPQLPLCYAAESSLVNIPWNAVSDDANQSMWGRSNAEVMNALFLDGMRIDPDRMDFSNVIGCHQEIDLRFKKNNAPDAKPTFSILHPTARLPDGWRPAYEQTVKNCDNPELIEYLLCLDQRDAGKLPLRFAPQDLKERFITCISPDRPCSVAAYNAAAPHAQGRIFINAQDDVFFPPHWDTLLLQAIEDHYREQKNIANIEGRTPDERTPAEREFVIHVSSGSPRDHELMAPQIMSRARYERYGHIFYPEYLGMYADDELTERAYTDGVVIRAPHLLFEQRHPAFEKAQWDEVYAHENSSESYRIGAEIIKLRRAKLGFSKASIPGVKSVAKDKPSLTVCLPGERFSMTWVETWTRLLVELLGICNVNAMFGYASNCYTTRGCFAQGAIQKPSEYVLWIDDDNLVSIEQVKLLIADLEAHPSLSGVAGWCFTQFDGMRAGHRLSCGVFDSLKRCRPFTAEDMKTATGLLGIDYTGFPCFLMRWEVLKQLMPGAFAPYIAADIDLGYYGEDVGFCIRAKEAGMSFAVDPRVKVPHLKLSDAGPDQQDKVPNTGRKEEVTTCQ